MFDQWPSWLGDINKVYSPQLCGVLSTLAAVVCGAAVGLERGRREKPAGLRTMMLICLGAAIFTQAGLLLSSDDDPARIAAQVVTGVGFLGAGAIIHGRGHVIGFTTAAAIWVVAAIGVIVGIGYVAAGIFFTALTLVTLALERTLDALIDGPCRYERVRIEFDSASGKTRWLIQSILDENRIPEDAVLFESPEAGRGVVTIRYCSFHRQHRSFLSSIATLSNVQIMTKD